MFGFLLTERAKMNKYQKLLGLNDSFTLDDLKMSYRKQVKLNHPDLFKTEKEKIKANRKMQKLNEAYQVLLEQLRNAEIYSSYDIDENYKTNRSNENDNYSDSDNINSEPEQKQTFEPIETDWFESLTASKCSYVLLSIIVTVISVLLSLN